MPKKLSDFVVGDRVVLIGDEFGKTGMSAQAGAFAKVTGKDAYWGWLRVEWDRTTNTLANHQQNGNYTPSSFEKAEVGTYIISSKNKSGKFTPAVNPAVYTSEAQALTVADKMAKQYGGEFFVFKAIAASIMPPPAPAPQPTLKRFA